jgi:Kef-type K+ transport system membrane component KefB
VHLFVGAALSAASVGITARVLPDLGTLHRPEGQIILGAAILDDVLGLIVLAIVTGIASATAGGAAVSGAAIVGIFLRAILFLGLTVLLGHFLSSPIVRVAARTGHPEVMLVLGLSLCFTSHSSPSRSGWRTSLGPSRRGFSWTPKLHPSQACRIPHLPGVRHLLHVPVLTHDDLLDPERGRA